jgi:3-dehydroshikimate dehydratase
MPTPKPLAITGFADEASSDFDRQVSVFKELGLQGIDVRSVDGIKVLDLSAEQLSTMRRKAEDAGLVIQAVGSPVNKVHLTPQNREIEFGKLQRAIDAANVLGTKRIRIFSPDVVGGESGEGWPEVKTWMGEQVGLCEKHGMLALHENDAKFYGAYPENARRLLAEFGGPHFKAAFDFANTVLLGYRPFPDWFPWLLPHIDTLHIKDAIQEQGKVVPAGQGDGQMVESFKWLFDQGWQGTLTLEPHLEAAGPLGGFSGEALFAKATEALHEVLRQAGE